MRGNRPEILREEHERNMFLREGLLEELPLGGKICYTSEGMPRS